MDVEVRFDIQALSSKHDRWLSFRRLLDLIDHDPLVPELSRSPIGDSVVRGPKKGWKILSRHAAHRGHVEYCETTGRIWVSTCPPLLLDFLFLAKDLRASPEIGVGLRLQKRRVRGTWDRSVDDSRPRGE